MRIRTIKPEFWAHPVMARQDDSTKLLALGLLNYADDEGYFYADEKLIRSSLRPFDDDSTIVRRSLERLLKIGYLSIVEHDTHGLIGCIVSFASHQRVDRPKPSNIKALYDSTNNRRMIDEESLLEGNREQGTGKGESISISACAEQPEKRQEEQEEKTNGPTLERCEKIAEDHAPAQWREFAKSTAKSFFFFWESRSWQTQLGDDLSRQNKWIARLRSEIEQKTREEMQKAQRHQKGAPTPQKAVSAQRTGTFEVGGRLAEVIDAKTLESENDGNEGGEEIF